MSEQVRRARGRIDPPNLVERHAEHAVRHAAVQAEFAADQPLPATYDISGTLVTPIKNQSQCGSCWDFSGTCVVESANILAGNLDNTQASWLSEQYTLDQCDGSNGGCGGDDNTTVLADAKTGGLPLTSVYGPYVARAESCKIGSQHVRSRSVPTPGKSYTLGDWGYVGPQTGVADTNAIKAAMIKYGAIGCAVAADDSFENYQPGTVYSRTTSNQIDHDVVLVGWDDTKQAWKMRNSWGTDWGNDGYMWIGYGVNQIGYEAVFGVAGDPVNTPTPVNPPTPPQPSPTRRGAKCCHDLAELHAAGKVEGVIGILVLVEQAIALLKGE